MRSEHIKKIVGKISDDIIEKYKLYEYRNQDIIQSLNLYSHIVKHIKDFKSVDSFNLAVTSIPNIILNPDFVYYDSNKLSLLYFKEIEENVCVVVKLSLRKNKGNYIATLYPVSKAKILRLKEKSYIRNNK